ncbi:unnamed protein product, partial [Musa banksii]
SDNATQRKRLAVPPAHVDEEQSRSEEANGERNPNKQEMTHRGPRHLMVRELSSALGVCLLVGSVGSC